MSKTRGVFSQRITNLTLSALLVATSIFTAVPFLLSQGVSALGVVTVTPSNPNGWVTVSENTVGGSASFVAGPSTPPLGSGSAQLTLTANTQGYVLAQGAVEYSGLRLADLTQLSYSTYVQQGNNTIAPALFFNISSSPSNGAWQGRLTYEPYQNSTVIDGTWQTHNPLEGRWWFSGPANFGNQCGQGAPCTVAQLLALYPDLAISPSQPVVGFKAGSGWIPSVVNIDAFAVNGTTYNFEPNPPADTVRPTVSFVNPSQEGQAFSGQAAISFSASDDVQLASMVVNIKDENNAGNLGSCGSVSGLSTSSYTLECTIDTTNFSDGVYYLRAGATDAAGNNRTISRSVIFDNTNPTVLITSPVANAVVGGSFTIEGTVSDATSGIDGVQIVINKWVDGVFQGRAVDFEEATVTGSSFQFNVSNLETLENGYYALRAIATDNAGNTKTTGHNVIVDGVRPVTTLVNPIVDQVNPTQVVVEATDNIGLSRVTANLYDATNTILISSCSEILTDGQTAYTLTCELGDSLADGTYTIRANAQDATGRTSNTVIRTFSIDTTPPQVTITGPATAAQGDDVTFNGEILGEFNDITITIDGVDYTPTIVDIVNGTWSFDFNTAGLTPGPFTVSVSAEDAAGNVSQVTEFTAVAFTVTEPEVLGENTDSETSVDAPGTDNTPTPQARNTPTIVGPANEAQVLGDTSDDQAAQSGATDVEGIDTVAQALSPDSEENQGTFAGLAWYWWLLIVAAIATIIGLIARSVRNRAQ